LRAITIIGAGVRTPDHLTLEADRLLRETDAIYHLLADEPAITAYLQQLNRPLVDLSPYYREDDFRLRVYEKIADIVLQAALAPAAICFVVPGHPLVYVTSSTLILDRAPKYGIRVNLLPGISSLDTMIVQLRLEIGVNGLQVFEANRFIYYQIEPDPRVPLFLFQPGCVGTGYITRSGKNRRGRFDLLRAALLRTYPPRHRCTLLVSQHDFRTPALRHSFPLSELVDQADSLNNSATLFVPPAEGFEIRDWGYYHRLLDRAHTRTLVADQARVTLDNV
jgi:Tetrapyrrole (Corrin/Porphyrin) Methylases